MKLNLQTYRDKVYACWIGKNIGGTMGTPYEGKREILDIHGFASEPGTPLPNDDLDLQLVWLRAMETVGPNVLNAAILTDYWQQAIVPFWNEYGLGKVNSRRGLLPPMSGDYNNSWKHSNGAWIRTEIWACLCPGNPMGAVKYAVEDAMVDHGTGEGTVAAAFVAAMQSAAFVTSDIREAIDVGLAAIPESSRMAQSLRLLFECYEQGVPPMEAREKIRLANADIGDGWFEAPSNVTYAILGLLYGEGDFKKSMILAINCGDDTDCTGATVGATLGILGGGAVIPEDWKQYIGDNIITISLAGGVITGKVPKTCTELTDRVVALAPSVLAAQRVGSVTLHSGENEIPADYLTQIKANHWLKAPLNELIPNSMIFNDLFMKITVVYDDAPEIAPLQEKKLHILFQNKYDIQSNIGITTPHNLNLRWLGTGGLTVSSRTALTLPHRTSHSRDASICLDVTVTAGETVAPINRVVLEVVNEGKAQITYVPITFLG